MALILSITELDPGLLTPMLQHYVEVKQQHSQAILLYRMGDFYEAFLEDACTIARELELVLTGKEAGKQVGRIAMAGIPYHALERYAAQLVEKGFAVAVCEQMETPAAAQGQLLRREVTQIITPGTVIQTGMLSAKRPNYLVAIAGDLSNLSDPKPQPWGLAYADISTGEFFCAQLQDLEQLIQELWRIQPAEVLISESLPQIWQAQGSQILPPQFHYTQIPPRDFDLVRAKEEILTTFQLRSLEGIGCTGLPLAVRAAGAILHYLQSTQKSANLPLKPPVSYYLQDYMWLDQQTRRNLEILQTSREQTIYGSLLWALDHTCTSMGARTLRKWLLQPLKQLDQISDRADSVEELTKKHQLRQNLRQILAEIYDIERLCSRIGNHSANGRDLVGLAVSLGKLTALSQICQSAKTNFLVALQVIPPQLLELADILSSSLNPNPPIELTEGNLILTGVNPELDQLRQQAQADVKWLAELEKNERDRTGINTLKVGFNKAFGYYISISRSKTNQAPPDYIRKQTLTNEERYITPELKAKEARILDSERIQFELEYRLFTELRDRANQQIELIRQVATKIAAVDTLASLAEVAVKHYYCRPVITSDRTLSIRNGRHPVLEQTIPVGFFVPNHAELGGADSPDLIILTGPNMSGKSIYLRQIGLIQLMAQIGSFVPADAATLGICDRIFTRVGAVDDLATGQSTFMVEMNETANILNHATAKSLVLLDEIGRGTSTFDGMAIAWSVAEYLVKVIKAKGIFATHYHELNELALLVPQVANFQVTVKELGDQIVFLHQVQPGGADRSYGIEVARLAGLPQDVITRAKSLLKLIASNSQIALGLRQHNLPSQLQIFDSN